MQVIELFFLILGSIVDSASTLSDGKEVRNQTSTKNLLLPNDIFTTIYTRRFGLKLSVKSDHLSIKTRRGLPNRRNRCRTKKRSFAIPWGRPLFARYRERWHSDTSKTRRGFLRPTCCATAQSPHDIAPSRERWNGICTNSQGNSKAKYQRGRPNGSRILVWFNLESECLELLDLHQQSHYEANYGTNSSSSRIFWRVLQLVRRVGFRNFLAQFSLVQSNFTS